jgi:hypothetical protein
MRTRHVVLALLVIGAAAEAERGAAGDANAAVKAAEAALGQARLDLQHTRIKAPADGIVGDLELRPGSFVTAGRALFALVETGEMWVDANFKETDLARIRPTPRRPVGTDWLGATLMIIGIGSLQTLLDRGDQEGWWQSGLIDLLTLTAVLGLALFMTRALSAPRPIVDLSLFRDRNLAVASGMMLVFGLGLFGTIAVQPIMLERLLGYPAETTGLVMAPRALGSAVSMAIVARLSGRTDTRWLVGTGMLLAAAATWIMSWYDLGISPGWIIWPGVLQGLGMGAVFVPLPRWPMPRCHPSRQTAAPACSTWPAPSAAPWACLSPPPGTAALGRQAGINWVDTSTPSTQPCIAGSRSRGSACPIP